jgi:hypothetical protein
MDWLGRLLAVEVKEARGNERCFSHAIAKDATEWIEKFARR